VTKVNILATKPTSSSHQLLQLSTTTHQAATLHTAMYISIATTLIAITASSSSVVAFQSPIGCLPVTTTTHKSQLTSKHQFATQYQLQPITYQSSSTSIYNLKGDDYLNSLNEGDTSAKTPTPPSESKQEVSGGGTASIPNEIFNLVKSIVGAGVLSLPAGTYHVLMLVTIWLLWCFV